MVKILLISFAFLALCTGSFAQDIHDYGGVEVEIPETKKNAHNFLTYQENIIKIKDGIWNIKKDLRDIYKIERWSVDKLAAKTQEVDTLREGMSYKFKRLDEYSDDEFSRDFENARVILKRIEVEEENIRTTLDLHYSMSVLCKDVDILVEKANNRVRQLFRTQKTIDKVYRSKRHGSDETISDLLMAGFLKRRARTQNLIKKISRIKIEVDEIKKARKNEFTLFKHTYQSYDIKKSRKKLVNFKKEISDIIIALEADMEEESVTKKAIFLL